MPAVSVPDLYINAREAISVLGNGFLRDQSLLDKCADREFLLSFYNELIIHTYRLIVTKVAASKGVIEEGTTPASIGGLFSPDSSPQLHNAPLPADVLDKAQSLLTRYTLKNTTVEIPWEDMNPESLGMVYEMLMEITPRLVGGVLELQDNVKGNARKTSGSYYTPKCLVETTLKNSLDVVLANADTVDDVLSLNIIDPACGSGNFLLGAVRRIVSYMESVAPNTSNTSAMVIKNCLYGIDLNRTAVEIAKAALWLEAGVQGSSIDDIAGHIITGNSLVGIADLRELDTGIPNKAYKCLAGDDKASCSWLKSQNTKEKKQGKVSSLFGEGESGSPDIELACNLYVSAYFADKSQGQCEHKTVPTTIDVRNAMEGNPVPADLKSAADKFANEYNPIHWPLVFPEIMRSGGFDAVIGNPPWERIKVSEKEFFAGTPVADEHNSSKRKKLIDEWGGEPLGTFKRIYYDRFTEAKTKALKLSNYFSADGHDHGSTDYRFPLTGHGDVNLYALFAEHCLNIAKTDGRVGAIVPTGICTDYAFSKFFQHILNSKKLSSIYDFENRKKLFTGIDSRIKFCVMSLGGETTHPDFAFFLYHPDDLNDGRRHFSLTVEDVKRISPNTMSLPVFNSEKASSITKRMYECAPVMVDDTHEGGNTWGAVMANMFDMTGDSSLFGHPEDEDSLPLYEGKMLFIYDHRLATYENGDTRYLSDDDKSDASCEISPRYSVPKDKVLEYNARKGWGHKWLMGWRAISRATDERTLDPMLMPLGGAGNSINLIYPSQCGRSLAALYVNLSSPVFDFTAKQKTGSTNVNFFILKQLPVLPPNFYTEGDLDYIVPRVVKLVYTSWSMKSFAEDMGYDGDPFTWDEEERHLIKSELDAWYARAYGLSRDDLRFILDPQEAMGEDYPGRTFTALKNREMRQYGEYKTARLVLAAYDKLVANDI